MWMSRSSGVLAVALRSWSMLRVSRIVIDLVVDLLRWVLLAFRSRQSISAENLHLRRQLALYIERGVKPRRVEAATRIGLTQSQSLLASHPWSRRRSVSVG
jgi:hypothetical protein